MSVHEPVASVEQRLHELTTINELIKTLTSTLDLSEVLRIVLSRIKSLTHAEALSLLLYDSERDELVFAAAETLKENALIGFRVPPDRGVVSWVARSGRSAVVNDVKSDSRFYAEIDEAVHFATRNLAAVPVKRAGRVLGALEVANRYDGSEFTKEDVERLEQIAAEFGESMEPRALVHDAEAMRQLLERVAATVPTEGASLLLYDEARRELVFKASRTLQAGVVEGMRLRCDQGIAGWVARHREPLRLDDATKDFRYYGGIETVTHFTPRSMMCVPILSKGTLLGVIQVMNKVGGGCFDENELQVVCTLADHAAIAIENASLYRQAYLASITDDLTGLGNTRYFNRMLSKLMESGQPLSLLVLDLDNFKAVVDTYGHLIGSRTIAYLGKVIGHLIRPGDIAARYGGDEFVILLPSTDAQTALEIAETVRAAVEGCSALEGNGVDISSVTASVGVATAPQQGRSAEEIFLAADRAMYEAKRSGKNRVMFAGSSTRGQ
jgi:diguanylate cyclase (GGDEF)-like protein